MRIFRLESPTVRLLGERTKRCFVGAYGVHDVVSGGEEYGSSVGNRLMILGSGGRIETHPTPEEDAKLRRAWYDLDIQTDWVFGCASLQDITYWFGGNLELALEASLHGDVIVREYEIADEFVRHGVRQVVADAHMSMMYCVREIPLSLAILESYHGR